VGVALTPMTTSLSRYLLLALVALAFLPSAAHAEGAFADLPVPAADSLTGTAHALAVARWGLDPCGGQVAVSWAHMGDGINARSQWMSVDIHDPSTYSQCSITYNLDIGWDWPKLCTVIEHELGHLAGHEHVNNPHDVMSPYYVFPAPECLVGQPGAQPVRAPVAVAQAPAATTPGNATSKRKVVKRKAAAKTKTVKRKVVKPKIAKRRIGKRSAKSETFACHCGARDQLRVMGTPTLTVVDPIRLFEGDVLALSVFR
jgi:hypothetical protein